MPPAGCRSLSGCELGRCRGVAVTRGGAGAGRACWGSTPGLSWVEPGGGAGARCPGCRVLGRAWHVYPRGEPWAPGTRGGLRLSEKEAPQLPGLPTVFALRTSTGGWTFQRQRETEDASPHPTNHPRVATAQTLPDQSGLHSAASDTGAPFPQQAAPKAACGTSAWDPGDCPSVYPSPLPPWAVLARV